MEASTPKSTNESGNAGGSPRWRFALLDTKTATQGAISDFIRELLDDESTGEGQLAQEKQEPSDTSPVE